ncbi:ATP-dependent zinc metalloprotease FtsH [Paradevosia shaoguanensis]|uniref:ATP-dependent zinc metalloprotease FtsH n=1 Tax=Paradevosia shaoguanensis TaxID=1335043 RepID=A0AA41QQ21_9HYPH|nr:ATP-dependent zinc metalloprotease FtsH [Paradevosia shaoguanensis]KFL25191.1 cell division protein FtsH [Devosia sp. 17-2-E-8]MCF1744442.1 ATP-dependent zinc metalloprotease FtsH [Paradevosia shaoguanensis]MCI0128925.1 ATP-dependent zinc metalloprotease FtsH [Paradevosia shaoguanensis]CDP52926.1 Cell division protein FtsH [Devosia sp. DBB001]
MNGNFRNFAIWLVILFMLMGLFQVFQSSTRSIAVSDRSYSQFVSDVDAGKVSAVTITDNVVSGTLSDGTRFETVIPAGADIVPRLEQRGVSITAKAQEGSPFWSILLSSWLPFIVIIGVWFFFIRQMQGGGRGGAMGFGKSRAKLLTETQGKVTFEDVAGVDEAKQDLEEIVEFLRDPGKFQRLGGRIPRGVLLVGPPGTGKTLLARSVAGEANVPFFTISGSDFVEMFVGVGASRVRDMFEQAKKNAPCIIFIDEIDAVGRHRGAGLGGGNDEREQTLNQLLVEMDGFEANEGIILIAATNRPDVLDPALLRPGRFDRQVVVPNPDVTGRERILKVHVRKVPLAPDVDLKVLARGTPGFSGADLMNLVNEGALLAARRNKRFVTMAEFEDAKDKLMMGAERRTLAISEEEKKLTAYHEAGHALLAIKMEGSDPIHKATIIPRGRALGMVMRLPEKDQVSLTRQKCYADLAVAMGGRVAEEEIFGYDKVTSGASADIKMATGLARAMATEFGMSDKLGPLLYGENQDEVFLGRSMVQRNTHLSDETQQLVDAEVKRFVEEGYQTAQKVIREYIDDLHTIAKALIEYETLTGDEIRGLMNGQSPFRESESDASPKSTGVPSAGKTSRRRPDAAPDGGMEPQPGN